MEVAEMKMLRFAMGVTRKGKVRNEYIRGTIKVERLGMKMREGWLRWYGHVMSRDQEYVGRRVVEMELPGKRKRGRPKRRFPDIVKEDMGEIGAREEYMGNKTLWRSIICCGNPSLMGKVERRRFLNRTNFFYFSLLHQSVFLQIKARFHYEREVEHFFSFIIFPRLKSKRPPNAAKKSIKQTNKECTIPRL